MATRQIPGTRHAGRLLISLLTLGLLGLAGCGQSRTGTSTLSVRATAATATPTVAITAASILQHAQSVKFTDATLTMTFEGNLGNVAGLGGLPGAFGQTS